MDLFDPHELEASLGTTHGLANLIYDLMCSQVTYVVIVVHALVLGLAVKYGRAMKCVC